MATPGPHDPYAPPRGSSAQPLPVPSATPPAGSPPGGYPPPPSPPAGAMPRDDLSAGSLLQATIDLVRAHPLPLLLPFVLLGLLSGTGGSREPDVRFDLSGEGLPLELIPFFALFGILALALLALFVLAYAFVWLYVSRAAADAIEGRTPQWGEVFDAVKPLYWGGTGAYVLWILGVIGGLILLIAPGLFLIVAWTPWAAVVVREGRTGPGALGRAFELTKGSRGQLFLLLLLGIVASFIVSGVFGILPVIGEILSGAASGVIYGAAAALGVVFHERRTRHAATPAAPAGTPPTGAPPAAAPPEPVDSGYGPEEPRS